MNGHGLPTPSESSAALESTRHALQTVIESFIELGVMVHDYPDEPTSREALAHKLQRLVADLREVSKSAADVGDVSVPVDILDYIDAGRNPDIYSREFIEMVVKQNQYIKGKMLAMGQFRDILAADLVKTFPDIADDVENAVRCTST